MIEQSSSAAVPYCFRAAYEANAFHQFALVHPAKLRTEANERGIRLPIDPYERLEWLDEVGAFCPILFEGEEVVYRDEHDFVPWEQYAVEDAISRTPRAQPRYSPWQLLYLQEAMNLDKVEIPAEWVLDDARWQKGHPQLRSWAEPRLQRWRSLDSSWRPLVLALFRIQGRYGPSIKGTLTKATVSVVYDQSADDFVDPLELESPWDAARALEELGATADAVKAMYENLAMHANSTDPLAKWYMLFRMAPFNQRARLRGSARRAHDGYDAALMLRRFCYDLTGALLLAPDEFFDVSDKSWKKELFGRWPIERFTRADLAVELRLRQLNPHEVHLVVEGETEHLVCKQVLEDIAGMGLNEMGISVQELKGVGGLRKESLRAVKPYARFLVLIADREGEMEREAERLIEEGILAEDAVRLWDTSFEEANFTDSELIEMIAELGNRSGVHLGLDVGTLRSRYDDHRAKTGQESRGLASFALGLAGSPAFGSVRVSKMDLAPLMAKKILGDLSQRDAEVVAEARPVVDTLLAIFRVT